MPREVLRRSSDGGAGALARQFGDALRVADEARAGRVVVQALDLAMTAAEIRSLVMAPAMSRMGELWEKGLVTVAEGRLATSICERALLPLQQLAYAQGAPAPRHQSVLLAAVAGQHHVLGLRMIADTLQGAGFEVRNFGADVSVERLSALVAEHEPAVVGLAVGMAGDVETLADSVAAIHAVRPSTRIMLGGRAVPPALWQTGYPRVKSSMDVVTCVEDLIDGPAQAAAPGLALLTSGRRPGSTAPPAGAYPR